MRSFRHSNSIENLQLSPDWAEDLRQRFLRRIENMAYEEVESEIPFAIGLFEQIYPERCPKKKEIVAEQVQPKFEQKCKKSQKHENQPSLF